MSLKALSDQALLSPFHLQRLFKRVMGVSPKVYHDAARMRLLKGALKSGKGVLEAIDEAGFQSTSRVYGQATRTLGMTPSTYRSGGAGETIAYAFQDMAVGPLLMAATERGVCFAQFGSSEQCLIEQLQSEFPNATVRASDATHTAALGTWVELLEAHIAAGAPRPDLPLDLRGTAFQIRVWRFLLSVPEGDVLSYSEVASAIGAPRAIRAAAAACGANRIAVLVPCHRVLRGDGRLGGYRWGLERKRVLIERERVKPEDLNAGR